MASQFELVAMLIDNDRGFQEVDEFGFGDLLKVILRECHDLNNEKYDATWLADVVGSHIAAFVTEGAGLTLWPEEEGSGPCSAKKWAELDAGPIAAQPTDDATLDIPGDATE